MLSIRRGVLVCTLVLLALVSVQATWEAAVIGEVGEGTRCAYNGASGTCTASACAGTSISGKCPGPAKVKCCLPKGTKTTASTKVAAVSGGVVTTTSIPYKFPYSTKRYIVADIARQRIRVYDGSKFVKEWKTSSGKRGVSFTPNSWGSPVGKFKVIAKIGDGQPLQMQFEGLRPIGKLGYPTDAKAHVQTRVLQLAGQDAANRNTASRSIYIHGTNAEMQLGWMGSHGCFRMGNRDVVELFNLVQTGVEFFVAPRNAWP